LSREINTISFPRDTCLHQNLHAETCSSHRQQKNYKTWHPTWQMGLPDSGSSHTPLCMAFSMASLQIKFLWSLLVFLPLISIQAWKEDLHHPRIPAYHLVTTKGSFFFTWDWYRLCQTGGAYLGSGCDHLALQWSPPSRRVPHYSGILRPTFLSLSLSLSLIKETSPLGIWRRKLQAQHSC
jgi:hypothetical protein